MFVRVLRNTSKLGVPLRSLPEGPNREYFSFPIRVTIFVPIAPESQQQYTNKCTYRIFGRTNGLKQKTVWISIITLCFTDGTELKTWCAFLIIIESTTCIIPSACTEIVCVLFLFFGSLSAKPSTTRTVKKKNNSPAFN